MKKRNLRIILTALTLGLLSPPVQADGKFSLRLQGGWAHISGGDVNHGTQAWFDLHKAGWEREGGYRAVHGGYELGGDIVFQLTPRLGVGIGGGYMRFSRYSSIDLSPDEPSIWSGGASAEPRLSAVPVRAGIYLNLPLKGKVHLLADAGLSYYLRARYEDDPAMVISIISPILGEFDEQTVKSAGTYVAITTRAENKKTPIGFQGGIGLEYDLGHDIFPFIEARARYARFRGWKGTSVLESNIEMPFSEQGILYYEVVPAMINAPRLIMVQSDPPDGPGGEPRQAALDFSGVSLQFGIRIRL